MTLVDVSICALADLCRFQGFSLAAGAETQLRAARMLHDNEAATTADVHAACNCLANK